uniref:Uncharacterized protein n=1 Tax=Rhizophora mucronata TaxID=61149 RepID=A0A2P2Q7R4_RHIMU
MSVWSWKIFSLYLLHLHFFESLDPTSSRRSCYLFLSSSVASFF